MERTLLVVYCTIQTQHNRWRNFCRNPQSDHLFVQSLLERSLCCSLSRDPQTQAGLAQGHHRGPNRGIMSVAEFEGKTRQTHPTTDSCKVLLVKCLRRTTSHCPIRRRYPTSTHPSHGIFVLHALNSRLMEGRGLALRKRMASGALLDLFIGVDNNGGRDSFQTFKYSFNGGAFFWLE